MMPALPVRTGPDERLPDEAAAANVTRQRVPGMSVSAMRVRELAQRLFGLFIAAMLGLAAGALWMVATLYVRHPAPWLALLAGALLAWTIRGTVSPPGAQAALLASLATLLAAIYVNLLLAGLQIAGNMGMSLPSAMRTAGLGMLWQMAQMGIGAADIGWAVLAAVLAAWLAWRAPRKRREAV
jgi:hypothetical protein